MVECKTDNFDVGSSILPFIGLKVTLNGKMDEWLKSTHC